MLPEHGAFMAVKRIEQSLSIFNDSMRRWTTIPPRSTATQAAHRLPQAASAEKNILPKQRLSLTSWNVNAFSSRPTSRARLILDHILERRKSPDVIFLQELTSQVRASILSDARVRAAFMVAQAKDETHDEEPPFATMTLLSSARFASSSHSRQQGDQYKEDGEMLLLGRVSCLELPSKYGREALAVEIVRPAARTPGAAPVFRLLNVHLDSLGDTLLYRAQQLKILADALREPGCAGGIIAGDFNAITPEDDGLLERNGLVDAWLALHGSQVGGPEGNTWGVGGGDRRDGLRPGRLDKVATMGSIEVVEMEVLRPGLIEVPRPAKGAVEIPWSDHCGLRCTLAI